MTALMRPDIPLDRDEGAAAFRACEEKDSTLPGDCCASDFDLAYDRSWVESGAPITSPDCHAHDRCTLVSAQAGGRQEWPHGRQNPTGKIGAPQDRCAPRTHAQ